MRHDRKAGSLTSRRRLVSIAGVSMLLLAISLAAPGASLASCVPIEMQTSAQEPGVVVMAGTITQVTDRQVVLAIQRWWGDGPQQSAAVERPATDPTVISSTDWSPQPGESWIVVARRATDVLTTNVCEQMPATGETIANVQGTLGEGTVPAPAGEASPAPQVDLGPILVGGAILLGVVAVGLVLARRRAAA